MKTYEVQIFLLCFSVNVDTFTLKHRLVVKINRYILVNSGQGDGETK